MKKVISGNQFEDINIEPYKKETKDLLRLANDIVVNNNENEGISAELISRVEKKRKEIKTTHESLVKPLKEHVKFINKMFESIENTLEEISNTLREKNKLWFLKKEKIAEEKRQKEMDKYNKKVEKAISENKDIPAFISKVNEPESRIITEAGSLSMQKFINFRVVDKSLVPREYLDIDEPAIRDAIKSGARNIPGVEIFEDVRTVNRR